jgi:AcrR family transcriptional regulator
MSTLWFVMPMPRKTYEEAQRTRGRILDIAIRHCREKGYDRFSLVEVALEANVTRGAIYHHFASKQLLFLEMVNTLLTRMGGAIMASAEKAPDDWQSLLAGCRTFLEVSQSAAYQTIILRQAPAVLGTEVWNKLDYEHTTDSLVSVLKDLEAAGVVSIPDPQATAEALSGAMNQLSLWVSAGHNLDKAWDTLALLLGALLTKEGRLRVKGGHTTR